MSSIKRNPFHDCSGTVLEHRFLNFFYNHTAPFISSYFDCDFWNELIPSVGRSEPAIRHAMITVAVVHARLEYAHHLLGTEDSRRFELEQYDKAIRLLRRHVVANGITVEVTLMCCVLLICLEFLRGSMAQAILHLQGGMNIMHSYHATTSSVPALQVSPSSAHIASKLEIIFCGLRIQWMLCGQASRPTLLDEIALDFASLAAETGPPRPFKTFDEARSSLNHVQIHSLRFVQFSAELLYPAVPLSADFDIEKTLYVTRTQLMTQFDGWFETFKVFVEDRAKEGMVDISFRNGCTLLKMHFLTSRIWLYATIFPHDMAWDDKVDDFAMIVELASSLTSGPLLPAPKYVAGNKFSFTFEMGVIAPLYLTAMKCRNRAVRRRAMSLLSSAMPRREGLWDADVLTYVIGRIVEIEEKALGAHVASSFDPVIAAETFMPTNEDRVVDVTIQHKGEDCLSITYMMRNAERPGWLFIKQDVVSQDGTYKIEKEEVYTRGLEGCREAAASAFEIGSLFEDCSD